MSLRDRPKYLPGLSYDQSGGPKSISRQNFEMSQRKSWVKPPCPRCHKVANVEPVREEYYCNSCDINFDTRGT